MSDQLKALLVEYEKTMDAWRRMPALKQKILAQMKKEKLSKAKVKTAKNTFSIAKQSDYEGMTQKLILRAIEKHYPSLNAKQVVRTIACERSVRVKENLKVVPKSGKK